MLNMPCTDEGATRARSWAWIASDIARIGLQISGLFTVNFPVLLACINIVLSNKSKRIRGPQPPTVPFLKQITEKSWSCIRNTPNSPFSFEMPYGYTLRGSVSSVASVVLSICPYTEHEPAYT